MRWMDWVAFGASVITAVCALIGTYWSNRKTTALVEYRLKELEKKVDKHNNLIDRMYKIENRVTVLESKEGLQ